MEPTTRVLTTDAATPDLLAEVRRLLDAAFGDEFSDHDWHNALGGWHVVVHGGGRLLAHAAVVPRTLEVGDRRFRTGYVESVAAAPEHHGAGHGSRAMRALAPVLTSRFELGALSTGRHAFYERLGWERWEGPTFVREGEQLRRTADEDDGVMVLRFGASRDVSRRARIVCEARPGDDW